MNTKMVDNNPEIGRVVFSKSGRDMGRYYLIINIVDAEYVHIADGKLRVISKPKKKKVKHISIGSDCLEGIAEKLKSGKKVFDKELYSALRPYNEKL